MRLHSYIVEHDCGFAPNPFYGACTLAACKPRIRKYADVGDFILGTGAKKRALQGRLVYLMRVGRIIGFDEYWEDEAFSRKKPRLNGSLMQKYGDNIYHREAKSGAWIQEDSFHSSAGGAADPDNLRVDTGLTDRVLIADWFCYYGGQGQVIPADLTFAVQTTQGHRCIASGAEIDQVTSWVRSLGRTGIIGEPQEWRYSSLVRRGIR